VPRQIFLRVLIKCPQRLSWVGNISSSVAVL